METRDDLTAPVVETPLLPRYRSLRELVAETLRKAIVEGSLRPGERIPEQELAKQFGISRSPIREALRELSMEGLVTISANRGASVANPSSQDIHELYGIRTALESLAVRWAVDRITEQEIAHLTCLRQRLEAARPETSRHIAWNDFLETDLEFHRVLVEASRSRRLSSMLRTLHSQVRLVMNLGTQTLDARRHSQIVEEHRRILEAVKARDKALTQHLIEEHLHGAIRRITAVTTPHEKAADSEATPTSRAGNPPFQERLGGRFYW